MKVLSQTSDPNSDLKSAQRVFEIEVAGLQTLSAELDERFSRALDLIAGITGRTVVSGMGKSGHVGRKIAATLASTGTPAIFVHPAEASHGDLGMITRDDAILALSNSGETSELSDLIAYSRRFAIPLIGMTGRHDSTLGRNSDVVLSVPRATEACPMGLAPTTSTTMMLALGDAIAIALLERRGFSASDFQVFHPGGQLGRHLVRVADIMHGAEEVPLTQEDVPMAEAILLITAKRFGCVGVLDRKGRLVGIITDGDLRRHMSPDILKLSAAEVMTPAPKTIRPEALAAEALGVMNRGSISSLFVVAGGRPQGIVHIHDCLRAGIV